MGPDHGAVRHAGVGLGHLVGLGGDAVGALAVHVHGRNAKLVVGA